MIDTGCGRGQMLDEAGELESARLEKESETRKQNYSG